MVDVIVKPAEMDVQEVFVPSVVRYLPLFPVWLGAKALKAAFAVVCPVPPLTILSVPAKVIAPVVAVEGVNPVVPAENVVTPPAEPLDAAVILPCASTVILVLV